MDACHLSRGFGAHHSFDASRIVGRPSHGSVLRLHVVAAHLHGILHRSILCVHVARHDRHTDTSNDRRILSGGDAPCSTHSHFGRDVDPRGIDARFWDHRPPHRGGKDRVGARRRSDGTLWDTVRRPHGRVSRKASRNHVQGTVDATGGAYGACGGCGYDLQPLRHHADAPPTCIRRGRRVGACRGVVLHGKDTLDACSVRDASQHHCRVDRAPREAQYRPARAS